MIATVYIEDNATYDGFAITKNSITVTADAAKGAKPIINGSPVSVGTEKTAIYITGNNATIQGLTINSKNIAYTKTIIVDAVGSSLNFKAFRPHNVTSLQVTVCGIDSLTWQNTNAVSGAGGNDCSSVDVDSDGCLVLTMDMQYTVPSLRQLTDIVFSSGGGGRSSDAGAGTDNQSNTSSGCKAHEDCSDGLYCNGRETCLDGACVSGDSPCGENQECDVEQEECFDVITVSTENVINKPGKPVFIEKLRQWLIIRNKGNINANATMADIKIQGDADDFHGVEVDNTRKCV